MSLCGNSSGRMCCGMPSRAVTFGNILDDRHLQPRPLMMTLAMTNLAALDGCHDIDGPGNGTGNGNGIGNRRYGAYISLLRGMPLPKLTPSSFSLNSIAYRSFSSRHHVHPSFSLCGYRSPSRGQPGRIQNSSCCRPVHPLLTFVEKRRIQA